MNDSLKTEILTLTKASEIEEVELIQSLWSGYGELTRIRLKGSNTDSVIVKNITLPDQSNHPRGWDTNRSHLRKIKSYQVEVEWYKKWAKRCNNDCRIPNNYQSISRGEEHSIILEDLDAVGFPLRKSSLNIEESKLGLKWLANFHAIFLNESPVNLWQEGTYWHLKTRPDELAAMESSNLKDIAIPLDKTLSACQYQTIVHGDAKLANFCFSDDMKHIAALDFQYVGGGCGMKDVVYFLGSCLTEHECEKYENELLDYYFNELKSTLIKLNNSLLFNNLEKEWRGMYVFAWADFMRFLAGWMPTHHKINNYGKKIVERALEQIKNQ